MPDLPYAVLDVFAERPLEGNPLAVFADGRGLTTEQMQAIARELNLSETTFVLPREAAIEAREGVRVRIFTTREELPFAGHPTLGTACWLRENHASLRDVRELRLALNAGSIRVSFPDAGPGAEQSGTGGAGVPGIFAAMEHKEPDFTVPSGAVLPDRAELAHVLDLAPEDIGLDGTPDAEPQVVSTGNPFFVVPLRSLAVVQRLRIRHDRAEPLLARLGARFFYCLARADARSGAAWRGRMQWYSGEDPATGSAAGCVAAWLVRHGLVASGEETVLEQGVEIGRPSRLYLRARLEGERVTGVVVGGRTIPVASGLFFLP